MSGTGKTIAKYEGSVGGCGETTAWYRKETIARYGETTAWYRKETIAW